MLNEDEMYEDPPDPSPLHRGDRLFMNDQAQLELDASENYAYHGYISSAFISYSQAYMEAADRLGQTLRVHSFDTLTLPIVFLYRHYVELTLKDLIIQGAKKYNKPSTPYKVEIPKTHRIDNLWQKLKPMLQQTHSPEKSEEIEVVEACIWELSRLDEGSFSFRYPVDTQKDPKPTLKNNPHLQDLEYIDVHHLAEKMESINAFFGLSSMLFILN